MIRKSFLKRVEPLVAYANEGNDISKLKQKDTYFYKGKEVKIGILYFNIRSFYRRGKLTEDEIDYLGNIGMVWEFKQRATNFEDRITVLVDFHSKCDGETIYKYPRRYQYNGKEYNLQDLGYMLIKQYRARNNPQIKVRPLSDLEVERLETIGFSFEKKKKEEDIYIDIMQAYYRERGPLFTIGRTNKDFIYNGQVIDIHYLISKLRRYYKQGKLTSHQVTKLEKLGMRWIGNNNHLKRFLILGAYSKEHGGFSKIEPFVYEGKKINIGVLINEVRIQYYGRFRDYGYDMRALDDSEVAYLRFIKFPFYPEKNVNYLMLMEPLFVYNKKYGSISEIKKGDTISYDGKEYDLYLILVNMKRLYQKSKLSSKYLDLLDKIGVDWNNIEDYQEKSINKYLYPFVIYYQRYGSINSITAFDTIKEGNKVYYIGELSTRIRSDYKKGNLDKDTIIALENMGMVWDIKNSHFLSNRDALCQFIKDGGDCNKVKQGDKYLFRDKLVDLYNCIHYLKRWYTKESKQVEEIDKKLSDLVEKVSLRSLKKRQ